MNKRKFYKEILIILLALSLLAGCGRKSAGEEIGAASENMEVVPETLRVSVSVSSLWYLYEEEQGEFCLYDTSRFQELTQYIEATLSKQVYSYEFNDEKTRINIDLTESQREELQNKVDQALVDAADFLKGELDYFVSLSLGENKDSTLEIQLEPESFTEAVSDLNEDNLMGLYNMNMLIGLCYLDKSLELEGISSLEIRFMNYTSGYCMMEYSEGADEQETVSFSVPVIRRSNYQDYSAVTTIPVIYQGNVTLHVADTDVEYASFLTLDDRYFAEGVTIYLKPSVVPSDLQPGSNMNITIETGIDTLTIIGDEANPDGIGFDGEVILE